MKIGRWIGLGIFLSIVGVGITAVASTQVDFNQEIKKVFIDPTMEIGRASCRERVCLYV